MLSQIRTKLPPLNGFKGTYFRAILKKIKIESHFLEHVFQQQEQNKTILHIYIKNYLMTSLYFSSNHTKFLPEKKSFK